MLQGVKVLKMYAWELPFMSKVMNYREEEIKCIKGIGKAWSPMMSAVALAPFLMTIVTFALFVYY